MYKIRRNDTVEVISGKDRGKKGKVLRVFPKTGRAIVEGINLVKKHQRRKQQDQQTGIVQVPLSVNISNLILICKNCNRKTRAGFSVQPDGTRLRVCKKCKEPI